MTPSKKIKRHSVNRDRNCAKVRNEATMRKIVGEC